MEPINIIKVGNQIQQLEAERQRLIKTVLAPEGATIDTYVKWRSYPSGVTHWYRYAKWVHKEEIFERKPNHRPAKYEGIDLGTAKGAHIGRVGSSSGLPTVIEVKWAYASLERRERLEAITKTLAFITSSLDELCNKK